MTARGASGSVLGTQFDDFLFASVGEDRNGPLSVLSALARLDVDPWKMAAALAQLPRVAAAQKLASLFAGLPDGPADRDAVAARLVAALPSQAGLKAAAPKASTPVGGEAKARPARFAAFYIISLLVVLAVQGLAWRHRQPPHGPVAQASAPSNAVAAPRQTTGGQ